MRLRWRDLVLLGVLIYFTFIGGTFYSQLNLFLRVANQVIVTAILAGWLVRRLWQRAGLPATAIDLGLGLYLLAGFISAGLGQSPRFSLETLWFSLTHVLAFYLLVDLARRGWASRLTWAFYMASAVVCLVALAEFVAWYLGSPLLPTGSGLSWPDIAGWSRPLPPQIYRLAITLNGPTILSAYLALLIPPAVGLVLSLPRRSPDRPALLLWLALAAAVQVLTFSRAGVLALGTSLPLTALAWYRLIGWRPVVARWQVLARPVRLGLLSLVVLTLLGGGFWLQRSLVNRAASTEFRLTLWQAAGAIFESQPWTGAGPGNFGRGLLRLNDAGLPRLQIASAHNVYLNTAAETGLLGLLAGVTLLLSLGRAWWQRWCQIPETAAPARLRLAACGAALAGLAVQTLVDSYSATPVILVAAALAAYCVAGLPETRPVRRRQALAGAALALLALYSAGLARVGVADWHYQNSFQAEAQGNFHQAIDEANAARRFDPWLTLHSFRLALLEARLADQSGDPVWREAAVDHYRQGLQREPILGLNSANLAGLLWQQGQDAEATALMQQTISAEVDPLYLVNLGYFYEQAGAWPEAVAAYGRALGLAPELAGSGFWQANPERAGRWPELVEAAARQLPAAETQPEVRARLALARQNFEAAAALLAPVATSPSRRSLLAETYLRLGRPDQAARFLPSVPAEARDYWLWGWLKLAQDDASAEQLLKIAAFLGENAAYYDLGRLYEGQGRLEEAERAYRRGFLPRATWENVEVTIYGRRAGNDLAPQLLRIGRGPAAAAPALALARLYESQRRFDEAEMIYRLLLADDPYLELASERPSSIAAP